MASEGMDDPLRGLRDILVDLGESQRRTQVQLESVTERLDALTERLDRLTERVDALTERLDRLTERVDALTQRMDTLTVRVDALTDPIDALARAQEVTERGLQRLEEQLSVFGRRADEALGYMIELRYRERAFAYFQPIARRLRVLSHSDLDDLLEDAIEQGVLTEDEAQEVRLADAVVRGLDRQTGEPVVLVVEASVVVDSSDVTRARQRARLLSRLGGPAVGVVAGREVLESAAAQARRLGVWQVLDGQAPAPSAA